MVQTRCPSISKFRFGFSFPSFGSGGASFGDILWAFSSVTFVFPFFPFTWICLVLVWLCLFSLLFCAFALTSSSYFLRYFLRPPGSGVLRRSCSLFFLFEVFLSAFKITFSGRPFFFLGVEIWLGPSVFSPALGSVASSLGSGKICSSVFSGPLAVQLRFSSACGSDRTLEFLHCEEVSGGPQVVLILGLSAGVDAPCLFQAGACGLSLCELLGEVFYSVFLSSACSFLFTGFSRQLAAIGVLFVVSSTGCCLNGSVLCSSPSQLSFSFPAMSAGGLVVFSLLAPCKFSFAFCGSFAPF